MSVDPERIIADIEKMPLPDGEDGELYKLLDFQREWIRGTFGDENINRSGLSISRGSGKTALFSALAACAIIPGMELHTEKRDVVAFASSFKQATILGEGTLNILRGLGIEVQYKRQNDAHNFKLEHKLSHARFRCFASNPKHSHGLRATLIFCDELAQWETRNGEKLFAAITTGLKKKGAKILCIGTRPTDPGHYFQKLLDDPSPNTHSRTYAIEVGKDDPFDPASWLKANPGLNEDLPVRSLFEIEAERAKADPAELARFVALKLNAGTSETVENWVIPVERWQEVEGVPDCRGPYYLGFDAGGSQAFSAAALVFLETGAVAVIQATGHIPTLGEKEQQENLPAGYYSRMAADGELLRLGEGRIVPIHEFLSVIESKYGRPSLLLSDRYRAGELLDSLAKCGWQNVKRRFRAQGYKDGAEDLRDFRKCVLEKKITVPRSRALLAALSGARTSTDSNANAKLAKAGEGSGRSHYHRDDLVSALILSAAEYWRRTERANKPAPRPRIALPTDAPPDPEKKRARGFRIAV